MDKFRSIEFSNHPILGDLKIDFCNQSGQAVDTVIIAGENGNGKSTLLNELYQIASCNPINELKFDIERDCDNISLSLHSEKRFGHTSFRIRDNKGTKELFHSSLEDKIYRFKGIFSDVDINFKKTKVEYVRSSTLDSKAESRRSSDDLSQMTKQLLVDIQTQDDTSLAKWYREGRNGSEPESKMQRFTRAYEQMFSDLKYAGVETENGKKEVYFTKNGTKISLDELSSGEKQIVYRGCFLLRDVNSLKGAFVFIDEPEISLHPYWQMKIMQYYKGIFTDDKGIQTSQIFVVTHSPFIIHNDNRSNDKVIVLNRDETGKVQVSDKPEYYQCNSIAVVEDAFSVRLDDTQNVVYLEGRTDEMYFNKAVEVFGYNVNYQFKWVGYLDSNGQERNTGCKDLSKAAEFLRGRSLKNKTVCLFDCDTKRERKEANNVLEDVMPYHENNTRFKKGIENSLCLEGIDLEGYYISKVTFGDYGEKKCIEEFKKMEFCRDICNLEIEKLKKVLARLEEKIIELNKYFS